MNDGISRFDTSSFENRCSIIYLTFFRNATSSMVIQTKIYDRIRFYSLRLRIRSVTVFSKLEKKNFDLCFSMLVSLNCSFFPQVKKEEIFFIKKWIDKKRCNRTSKTRIIFFVIATLNNFIRERKTFIHSFTQCCNVGFVSCVLIVSVLFIFIRKSKYPSKICVF